MWLPPPPPARGVLRVPPILASLPSCPLPSLTAMSLPTDPPGSWIALMSVQNPSLLIWKLSLKTPRPAVTSTLAPSKRCGGQGIAQVTSTEHCREIRELISDSIAFVKPST